MIINATNSQVPASLLQSASAKLHKHKANAAGETADSDSTISAADQSVIASQNIVSAISPLKDADATRAALQAVRKQFLAQPDVAMLAQAKQVPQNALRLLQ